MPRLYGDTRSELLDNGYDPIPCKGKRPLLPDWQNRVGVEGYERANAGLLTKHAPALDLDIDDEETQATLARFMHWRAPGSLKRTGKGHKCLHLFSLSGAPFPKMRREYQRGEERGAVELLADGQMFIAAGVHPDTGKEYTWPAGSPLTKAVYEIDSLGLAEARKLLDDIEGLLLGLGWERVSNGGSGSLVRRKTRHDYIDYVPSTRDEELAIGALEWIDSEDYGSWIAAGMALKAEGLPFELWLEWSRTAPNFDPDACEKKWGSFEPSSTGLHALLRAAGKGTAELDFSPIPGWEPTGTMQMNALRESLQAAEEEEEPVPADPKRRFETLADVANRESPPWLVKNLIPQKSLVGLIAAPNVGKSFLLLDLCAAIERANGTGEVKWFGRRVKAGPTDICVIFSYEGSANLRAKALLKRYPGIGRRIVIERGWPNLRDPESVAKVVSTIKAIEKELGGKVALIAFDTLNLALSGGNENAPEDMGAAVAALKLLRDAHKCAVVAVHHLGKDASKGARGHSSLLGALDTEITVTGDPKGAVRTRTVELTKIRDGDRTGEFGWFNLRVVELGFDEDGDVETSCVVEPTIEEAASEERMSAFEARVREALMPHPEGLGLNQLQRVMRVNKNRLIEDIQKLVEAGVVEEEKAPRRGRLFRIVKRE